MSAYRSKVGAERTLRDAITSGMHPGLPTSPDDYFIGRLFHSTFHYRGRGLGWGYTDRGLTDLPALLREHVRPGALLEMEQRLPATAEDLEAGDAISHAGVRAVVIARTPAYEHDGTEMVTLVLHDDPLGSPFPVQKWADRPVKMWED